MKTFLKYGKTEMTDEPSSELGMKKKTFYIWGISYYLAYADDSKTYEK